MPHPATRSILQDKMQNTQQITYEPLSPAGRARVTRHITTIAPTAKRTR